MFYDLNVPVSGNDTLVASQSKKSKGKQPQQQTSTLFTAAQIAVIEARIDLLVHRYNVIAFNQTVHKKLDPKTHVNVLNALLPQLKSRAGVLFLKRLTIVLDEESEKGFGLTSANASAVEPYDLVSLVPTTTATFSLACLTHSLPSPLTAHIISLPLTSPRLPFHLKHTLVRTAIKNGAVFEINYVGALGETSASSSTFGVGDSGPSAKRNWWAAAREVVRVTKGKGIIVSGGVLAESEYRGPKDVQNLICLLGLAQNLAHDASVVTPKSLIIRAQTRKTYRAVFSEPKVVFPQVSTPQNPDSTPKNPDPGQSSEGLPLQSTRTGNHPEVVEDNDHGAKKRPRECDTPNSTTPESGSRGKGPPNHTPSDANRPAKKKKGKHAA
ncbi:hypothetical protein ID866_6227 [Astraeus odoratus]|nr:hypothetical protein ID866_6227 [Astraeus odoratus]